MAVPWIDYVTRVVAACGVVHSLLPPWDWKPDFVEQGLAEFPKARSAFYWPFHNRWYRLLIYITGYVALHARSTVWHYISVNNLTGPNANLPINNLTGPNANLPTEDKK
jgi:hypothetical protein